MLILNACTKHGAAGIISGMSKDLVKKITEDIHINQKDIVRVVIIFDKKKFTSILFDKKTFVSENIEEKYYSKLYGMQEDNDGIENDFYEFNGFYEKYLGEPICGFCLKEYEAKHKIKISSYLLNYWNYLGSGTEPPDPESLKNHD